MAYGVQKFRPLFRAKLIPHVTQVLRIIFFIISLAWVFIIAGKVGLDDGDASLLFGFAAMILCPLACFACLTGLLEALLSPYCLGWGLFTERTRPGGERNFVSGFFFENFPKSEFRNGAHQMTGAYGIPVTSAVNEATTESHRQKEEYESKPRTIYFVTNIIFSFFVLFLPLTEDDFSIAFCISSVLFGLVVLLFGRTLYVFQLTDDKLLSLHEKGYIVSIGMWGVRNWAQQVKRARFEGELERRLLRSGAKRINHPPYNHPLSHLTLPSHVATPESEAQKVEAKRFSRHIQIIVSIILATICTAVFLVAVFLGPPHGSFSRPRYIAMLTLPYAFLFLVIVLCVSRIDGDRPCSKNYRDRKVLMKTVDAVRVSGPPVSYSLGTTCAWGRTNQRAATGARDTATVLVRQSRDSGRRDAESVWPKRLSGETLV